MPALFLDRDGVLNARIPGDYVKTPDALTLVPGFDIAMAALAPLFFPIVVVTNQAGVAKGLMTPADLDAVHEKLLRRCAEAGGRIDRIYACTHRSEENCPCRKPATGMAWQALVDFPEMVLQEAWMVGDSASDMEFGQKLGMKTALIAGKTEERERLQAMNIPFSFKSLPEFAIFVEKIYQ